MKNAQGKWFADGAWKTATMALAATADNPAKMFLFGRTYGKDLATMRLYGFDVYEDDALVHSFTPTMQGGVAGLWDSVEKKFYGNAATADCSGFSLHGAGANGSGPVFVEQPQNGSISRDGSLTLSAYAPGASGYLWLKNGEIVEGVTGRTLEVAYGRGGKTDEYRCIAHYGDIFGYGVSETAEVLSTPSAFVLLVR